MSAATVKKAARDLQPLDVIVFHSDARGVVTHVSQDDPRQVRLMFAMLGACEPSLSAASPRPDTQFTVELRAGLTPVQARADELFSYVKEFAAHLRSEKLHWGPHFAANLQDTINELDPLPPTLEEAVNLLREVRKNMHPDSDFAARFDELLKRVPN